MIGTWLFLSFAQRPIFSLFLGISIFFPAFSSSSPTGIFFHLLFGNFIFFLQFSGFFCLFLTSLCFAVSSFFYSFSFFFLTGGQFFHSFQEFLSFFPSFSSSSPSGIFFNFSSFSHLFPLFHWPVFFFSLFLLFPSRCPLTMNDFFLHVSRSSNHVFGLLWVQPDLVQFSPGLVQFFILVILLLAACAEQLCSKSQLSSFFVERLKAFQETFNVSKTATTLQQNFQLFRDCSPWAILGSTSQLYMHGVPSGIPLHHPCPRRPCHFLKNGLESHLSSSEKHGLALACLDLEFSSFFCAPATCLLQPCTKFQLDTQNISTNFEIAIIKGVKGEGCRREMDHLRTPTLRAGA